MGGWLGNTALGLPYGQVRLVPSDPPTAVAGLAAKPILDVAIGLAPGTDPKRAVTALQPLGCRFRGDKGGDGGLLLVLENRPAHRVAHLHLVGHGDVRWRRYLALRDRLRADSAARAAYAQIKGRLAVQFSGDRRAYTAAKAAFIQQLLSEDQCTATPNTADQ